MRGVFEECAFTCVDSELSLVTRMEIFTYVINSGIRGIWQWAFRIEDSIYIPYGGTGHVGSHLA